MNIRAVHPHPIRLLFVTGLLSLSPAILYAQSNDVPLAGPNNIPENQHKVAPLVIMEKTALTGRIVFMQEDEKDEEPGAKLDISILSENKRKSVYETKTDDQGLYQIPKLEPGIYWMLVGQLYLRLRVNSVEDETAATNGVPHIKPTEKAKVLVIFIPRDMA